MTVWLTTKSTEMEGHKSQNVIEGKGLAILEGEK